MTIYVHDYTTGRSGIHARGYLNNQLTLRYTCVARDLVIEG